MTVRPLMLAFKDRGRASLACEGTYSVNGKPEQDWSVEKEEIEIE